MPDLNTGAELIAASGHMNETGWVTVAGRDQEVEALLAREG